MERKERMRETEKECVCVCVRERETEKTECEEREQIECEEREIPETETRGGFITRRCSIQFPARMPFMITDLDFLNLLILFNFFSSKYK